MVNLVKRISQQTFWQVLGKVVTSLSTFIILGIVARTYGEFGTGIFTLALTYLSMFFLIVDFGFNAHILRKDELSWEKLLGTRIAWAVILTVIALLILPLFPFATLELKNAVLAGSLAILGSALFVTSNLVFQAKLSYSRSVLASSLGTGVYLILVLYLASQKTSISSLTFAQAVGWLVIGASSLMLVRRFINHITPQINFDFSLKLIKESWPIAATLTLNVVYFRADAFILASFKGAAETGIYNVAYSLFQTAVVLPTFIMNSYYPLILESLKTNTGKFKNQVKLVAFGLLTIACLVTLLTYLLAPWIVQYLTGGGFLGASESLQILSLSFPAFFLSSLGMWLLVALGKYKVMLTIYGLGLIFNLLANLIYIPQYGINAAAWITVVSEYLILLMQAVIVIHDKR